MRSFPVTEIDDENVFMKIEIFVELFKEVTKYMKEQDRALELIKLYNSAIKIKRKRIRLKKEKEVLIKMHKMLFNG